MMRRSVMPIVASRQIHARGYNNFNDHVNMTFHEINFALNHAKNTENIAYIYEKFGDDVMTPE